ncbi:MAG: phosphoribosyltransferase family protein [Lentisphaeria bacterium]
MAEHFSESEGLVTTSSMNQNDFLIVSTVSDDPFAIDVAHFFGQQAEIADLIALKRFANTEFCPRFISDESDFENIGMRLQGKTVVIVSSCCGTHTRNARAMRTCLTARAAKDNGASRVILIEPDLFYSAQDRGPQPEHGEVNFERSAQDYKKFDGQPFSARLYADLLKASGVDGVVTVHNHSISVQKIYNDIFTGKFHNLTPSILYANFLNQENVTGFNGGSGGLVLCAPDAGAAGFVKEVYAEMERENARMLIAPEIGLLLMSKNRFGERHVEIQPAPESPMQIDDIQGRTVVVFDDMVRTGGTISECCHRLKEAGANKVVFVVTHFYSSDEVKENLNTPAIDEIVTSNTLPAVLNRDMQGRLRKKMLVLKIEKWIASYLTQKLSGVPIRDGKPLYAIDMSSKNPRAQ